jgi:hypothetical protein
VGLRNAARRGGPVVFDGKVIFNLRDGPTDCGRRPHWRGDLAHADGSAAARGGFHEQPDLRRRQDHPRSDGCGLRRRSGPRGRARRRGRRAAVDLRRCADEPRRPRLRQLDQPALVGGRHRRRLRVERRCVRPRHPHRRLRHWPAHAVGPDRLGAGERGEPTEDLYTASFVGIDVDTGALRWYRQIVPGDEWDMDQHTVPMFANVDIDGQDTRVALLATTSGYILVVDAMSGELLRWHQGAERGHDPPRLRRGRSRHHQPRGALQ